MGIVYSVEHIAHGRAARAQGHDVAHHGATRDAIERFKREARASAKIKSEHVVRIIDADVAPELDRAPYLVMDLLDGDRPREGRLPTNRSRRHAVLEWLRQIARALDKAHRIGIVHRDLKPENLFSDVPRRRSSAHQDPRLRHRQDRRGIDGHHAVGPDLGHAALHVARASARRPRAYRPILRSLCARAHRLQAAYRDPLLERHQRRRHHRPWSFTRTCRRPRPADRRSDPSSISGS